MDYTYNKYVLLHLSDVDSMLEINKFGSRGFVLLGQPFPLDNEYFVIMCQTENVPSLPIEFVKGCLTQIVLDNKPKNRFSILQSNDPNSDIIIETINKIAEMLEINLEE